MSSDTAASQAAAPPFSLLRRPLAQLILCRLREFYREPEAIFWVYGFPILTVPTPQLSQRGGRQISECGTDISNNH